MHSCDLEENYFFHLYYLGFIGIALMPTDIYAYINNKKIEELLSHQTYQVVEKHKTLTLGMLFSRIVMLLLNLACSASQFLEFYSDLLIVWVSLVSQVSIGFGIAAMIFPLINRVGQLYYCVQLFVFGLKMKKKTIVPEKIDQILIFLNLFNMSRLLFPNLTEQKPLRLMIVIIKECFLKLLQIILKLVLITPTLSEDCSGNVTVLTLMLIGNLMSMI